MVRQVENVLLVLEYFAERRAPATVAEMTDHFGWPRSSAFNIVSTLAERGYLYEPRARGAYYPTPRWLTMAQAVSEADPVPAALTRVLDRLVDETGETAWIARASGLHVVMLDVRESPQMLRYVARPGMRLPIHVTGSGQALMARMATAEREALLKRIRYQAYNRNSPMEAETVRQQIADSEERGWFMSNSAFSSDLAGVALPIRIDGHAYAVTTAGPENRFVPRMPEIAAAIRGAVAAECGAGALDMTPLRAEA
ncbi:IclR family transcriptional regulator [Pseudooceanicola pacificus]|nr:IclR family transcriptional regulator [Pseudooceanicola pacificus]